MSPSLFEHKPIPMRKLTAAGCAHREPCTHRLENSGRCWRSRRSLGPLPHTGRLWLGLLRIILQRCPPVCDFGIRDTLSLGLLLLLQLLSTTATLDACVPPNGGGHLLPNRSQTQTAFYSHDFLFTE